MYFGFALELSDIDLWNINMLDTHLDLLDTDIPSVSFLSIVSSRRLQDMPSKHLDLEVKSSRRLQDMSSRRLQDIFSVSVFRLRRRLQDQQVFAGIYLWDKHNSKINSGVSISS